MRLVNFVLYFLCALCVPAVFVPQRTQSFSQRAQRLKRYVLFNPDRFEFDAEVAIYSER